MTLWLFIAAWLIAFWFARALWRLGRKPQDSVLNHGAIRAKLLGGLRFLAKLSACGLGALLLWLLVIMVGGFVSAFAAPPPPL